METKGLKISYEGAVQILEFNNVKKRNALNYETYFAIIEALDEASKRNDITVTVLTGAGPYYSSGNDFSLSKINADLEDIMKEALLLVKKFVDCLIDYPKVLIAVVNGPAIGIAVTTLALCDAVYASENATFHTPFCELGLSAEGCSTYLFPKIMGTMKAKKMLLFSQKIDSHEALKCGLISEIYLQNEKELVMSKIKKFSSHQKETLLVNKQLLNSREKELLHQVNKEEVLVLADRCKSEEFLTAIIARLSNQRNKL